MFKCYQEIKINIIVLKIYLLIQSWINQSIKVNNQKSFVQSISISNRSQTAVHVLCPPLWKDLPLVVYIISFHHAFMFCHSSCILWKNSCMDKWGSMWHLGVTVNKLLIFMYPIIWNLQIISVFKCIQWLQVVCMHINGLIRSFEPMGFPSSVKKTKFIIEGGSLFITESRRSKNIFEKGTCENVPIW